MPEIKIRDKLYTCQVIERPGENDSFKLPRIILYGHYLRRERGVQSCFKYIKKGSSERALSAREKRFALHRGPSLVGQDPISSRTCGSCHLANSHTSSDSERERKRIRFSAGAPMKAANFPNNLRLANFGLTAGEPPAKHRTKRTLF